MFIWDQYRELFRGFSADPRVATSGRRCRFAGMLDTYDDEFDGGSETAWTNAFTTEAAIVARREVVAAALREFVRALELPTDGSLHDVMFRVAAMSDGALRVQWFRVCKPVLPSGSPADFSR